MLGKILKNLGGMGCYEPRRAQGEWRHKLRAMEARKRAYFNFENLWGSMGVFLGFFLVWGSLAMLWKSLLLNLEANGEEMREYGA